MQTNPTRTAFHLVACLMLIAQLVLTSWPVHATSINPSPVFQPVAGQPWIRYSEVQQLDGPAGALDPAMRPVSLTAVDLNADGAQDVIVGYASQTGGYLSVFLGAANSDGEEYFHPSSQGIDLEFVPDWLGCGDMDGDGNPDLVTAGRGSLTFRFFLGDGSGDFTATQSLFLSSAIQAIEIGELGRQDALAEVVVGLTNGEVLIYSGLVGIYGTPSQQFTLPSPIIDLALGQADSHFPYDLVISAGTQIHIRQGQDQMLEQSARTIESQVIELGFTPGAIRLGNFLDALETKHEIAITSSSGDHLYIMDTTGLLLAETQLTTVTTSREDLMANHVPTLLAARSSSLPSQDLLVIDQGSQTLEIWNTHSLVSANPEPIAILQQEKVIAALPVRLNGDAQDDLVYLSADSPLPRFVITQAERVFEVTWSADIDDDDIGDGICDCSGSLEWGLCSLRAAIQEANASPGLDEIHMNSKYMPSHELPQITEAVIITGTSGGAEINGSNLSSFEYGLWFTSAGSTVNNIKFTGFQSPGLYLQTGGNHVISNNRISGNLGRGITITSNGNQIQNNSIVGNEQEGIAIFSANNTVLKSNRIGFWPGSVVPTGNKKSGVIVNNSTNTVIGGSLADRNYISGNWDGGIYITGGSTGTLVQHNYIGSSENGASFIGNDGRGGIDIYNAPSTTIGGEFSSHSNLIGANRHGVTVRGNSGGTVIRYNQIGLTASGTANLRNQGEGIWVQTTGGSNTVRVEYNTVAGNASSGNGILLSGSANPAACIPHVVLNNIVGTNSSLSTALGLGKDGIQVDGVDCVTISQNRVVNNADDGIDIRGDSAEVAATLTGNIASSNHSDGIELNTDFNSLTGNRVSYNGQNGLSVFSNSNSLINTEASFNTIAGIVLYGDDNLVQGPDDDSAVVTGNSFEGIILSGNMNTVLYTWITANSGSGVRVSGYANQIGDSGIRNVITGNAYGIELDGDASETQIRGNYIGIEGDGTTLAGNAFANIWVKANQTTIGGNSAAFGNVVSGAPAGILISNGMTETFIGHNKIGTTATGTGNAGNTIGVKVEQGSESLITNNLIAYNRNGIVIEQGVNNQILRNRIFNSTQMGIDLLPGGVSVNDSADSDQGANGLQNFPILASAGLSAGTGRVQGSLNSAASTSYTLNFFSVPFCDTSGYGEGEVYLGEATVITDADGQADFNASLSTSPTLNHFVTSTATDPNGNTSEYSRCVKVGVLGGSETFAVNLNTDVSDANLSDGVCDINTSVVGLQCTLRAAVQQANANSGYNIITLPRGEYSFTRAGSSENAASTGDLDITDELYIRGSGANITVINASGLDRVFDLRPSISSGISGVTIKNGNPGNSGGGGILVNSGASLALEEVNVQDNQVGSSAGGGGIFNQGLLNVFNSALVNNQAGSNGGGFYQFGPSSASTWTNSTFSANRSNLSGGGIYAEGSAQVTLRSVTLTENIADADNNASGDGGGISKATANVTLQNSIVAGNLDYSHGSYENGMADCAGTFTSGGYNLIGDKALPYGSSTPGCSLTGGTGDSIGGSWLMSNYLTWASGLGPLQWNGGTTLNHSPIAVASGLVVDWANPAEPGSSGGACELLDQRGQPRPIDGGTDGVARCDRGAIELTPITVSINDVTLTEGSVAQFTVSLSASPQIEFSVGYTTAEGSASAGSDYQSTSGTLTFPAGGATSQTVSVTTLTDTLNEDTETFQLNLVDVTYALVADGQGLGTLLDGSPLPSLLINDVSVTEGDSGSTGTATFHVTLNSVSARRIELQYATNNGTATGGEDFSPSNGTLVFAPGATSQNINITIFGDNLKEGNETFSITLSNPMNATLGDPSGIGTIIDQDIPSFSIQEASVVEGDAGTTAMNFAVLLSKPSTSETRVNFITSPGTAVSGSDYQHTSGTLVFAPGETAKLVTISIIGDNAVEDDETFQVSLNTPTSGAVIGSGTATGSIFDNDDPQPSFTYCYLPILVR